MKWYIAVDPNKKKLYAAQYGSSRDWPLFYKEGTDRAVPEDSQPEWLLFDSEEECDLAINQIYEWAGRRLLGEGN